MVMLLGCQTSQSAGEPIHVISREDGSGTRSAFIELFGVEVKQEDGSKVDMTLDLAEITNNTSVMMISVSGDKNAIGYISLGSLNDTVKAVSIAGVAPSIETVRDGSYTISRPFNIVTLGTIGEAAQDFLNYILSQEGQAVVETNGYIPLSETSPFSGTQPSGKVVVAGSSSVTPVMEKLKEAYGAINPNLNIEIQQSDSTTGVNATLEGICELGMASRELKETEIEKGLAQTRIALDGIAVIVNKDNAIGDLTAEQVKAIYTGEITEWFDAE
ncbi:MAG: substrate-binding domain-containing protein [Oscillospiraceae bacterium]|nr:substrate-binding domain-containing protein [Oscillospiraceae bacterium]